MSLPLDLILIRHGQSEGNVAKRLSEKGDNSAYTLLHEQHTSIVDWEIRTGIVEEVVS